MLKSDRLNDIHNTLYTTVSKVSLITTEIPEAFLILIKHSLLLNLLYYYNINTYHV